MYKDTEKKKIKKNDELHQFNDSRNNRSSRPSKQSYRRALTSRLRQKPKLNYLSVALFPIRVVSDNQPLQTFHSSSSDTDHNSLSKSVATPTDISIFKNVFHSTYPQRSQPPFKVLQESPNIQESPQTQESPNMDQSPNIQESPNMEQSPYHQTSPSPYDLSDPSLPPLNPSPYPPNPSPYPHSLFSLNACYSRPSSSGWETDSDMNSETIIGSENGIKTSNNALVKFINSRFIIMICSAGLLVSAIGNTIYFKKITNAVPNYGWFLAQFTTVSFIPLFGVVVIFNLCRGLITQDQRSFAQYKYLIMGGGDSLAGIMMVTGGSFTSGPTQIILRQGVIPITMILSKLMLKRTYHWLQYSGSLVIIFGISVIKIPDLLNPSIVNSGNLLIFNILFFSATLPTAFTGVYKEVAFRGSDVDLNHMQFFVALYQFMSGYLFLPLLSLPFLGAHRITFDTLLPSIKDGFNCVILGINAITENCGVDYEIPCDNCSWAWIPVAIYISFNICFNIFLLLVYKHGSATLSLLISTLTIPLSSVAFYSSSIMGDKVETPKLSDFIGLTVLLSGLAFYRFGSYVRTMNSSSTNLEFEEATPYCMSIVEREYDIYQSHQRRKRRIRSKVISSSPHELPYGLNPRRYYRPRSMAKAELREQLLSRSGGGNIYHDDVYSGTVGTYDPVDRYYSCDRLCSRNLIDSLEEIDVHMNGYRSSDESL